MTTLHPGNSFGIAAFLVGALALLIAAVHMFAGPFAPVQSLEVSLGDMVAETGKATLRGWFGLAQPEAQPRPWDTDRMVTAATSVVAVIALMLAGWSAIRHEAWRAAAFGTSLAVAALGLQFMAWAFMALVAIAIVGLVLYFLGDFFSFG